MTAWQNETVDSSANVGQYTSLVFDSSGNPQISYYDVTHKDLKFAHGYLPLLLNISASPVLGVTPLTVQFSDSSTGGLPSCWNWSFGDGIWFNTSQEGTKNPLHTYTTAGRYTVNLTMQNFSVVDTLSRKEYIIVSDPPVTTRPTPTPSAEVFGSSDDAFSIRAQHTSSTGNPEKGSLTTSSINAGGDSAIRRVTVTGEEVSDMVITATKLSALPGDMAAPESLVYQYVGISPAHYSSITAAKIEFDVPLSFIDDQHGTPADVRLHRFDGNTWSALPTQLIEIKNGFASYYSQSPGFSFFAISVRDYMTDTQPVTPAITVLLSPEPPGAEHPDYHAVIVTQTSQPVPACQAPPLAGIPGLILVLGIISITYYFFHRMEYQKVVVTPTESGIV